MELDIFTSKSISKAKNSIQQLLFFLVYNCVYSITDLQLFSSWDKELLRSTEFSSFFYLAHLTYHNHHALPPLHLIDYTLETIVDWVNSD